ncbi:hypothetical protein LTR49_028613, partial [Elasticomyces elasticus]
MPNDLEITPSTTFSPEFAFLTQSTTDLLQLLARTIEETYYTGDIVSGLLQKIEGARMSNITKECRIAVTGDVTAANSEAINAILSWCIIARQGFQGGNRDKILEDLMYTPPGQMK